jgi:hypothetical protein
MGKDLAYEESASISSFQEKLKMDPFDSRKMRSYLKDENLLKDENPELFQKQNLLQK